MSPKSIALFHPFTAQSVGLIKDDLFKIHSRSHIVALKKIAYRNNWDLSVNYLQESSSYECVIENGVCWKFWPLSFINRKDSLIYRKQWSVLALISHFLHTPDLTVINFSGLGSTFSQILAKISLLRKKKYIAMIGKNIGESKAQASFLRNASQIFVHSKKQLELPGINSTKVNTTRFLPLGVDTKIFSENLSISSINEFPKLLFVGRIVESKGILLALEAFNFIHRKFPNSQFNIIGPCSDAELVQKINGYIFDHELSARVNLIGALPYNDLPQWYQNSDLFIFPSSSESFGMVIIESMACGTPVIALRDSGGPDEIIVDDICGLLVTPETFQNVLLDILQNREKLEKMRCAASQRIKEFYSIERTCRILDEVIKNILGDQK